MWKVQLDSLRSYGLVKTEIFMGHYAKVENGIVTQVIVADLPFIQSGAVGDPSLWVQTSYNTKGGQHPEGRPLRKNYAGIGYTYDSGRDAFVPPKPWPSWLLDEETCLWNPPVAYPEDGKFYRWDEPTTAWVEMEPPGN